MKGIIRLGDPTNHGGKVVSAHGSYQVQGVAVARAGDSCSCPKEGHGGTCTITKGNPNHLVGGMAVAFDGCRTSCGAVVNTTFAPESLSRYLTSSDLNIELTETTMAPTFSPAR